MSSYIHTLDDTREDFFPDLSLMNMHMCTCSPSTFWGGTWSACFQVIGGKVMGGGGTFSGGGTPTVCKDSDSGEERSGDGCRGLGGELFVEMRCDVSM